MSIRLATVHDLERINELYNQAVLRQQTADTIVITTAQREQWFLQHNPDEYPVFVYTVNEVVAGWISFSAYRAGRHALRHTSEISYYIDAAFRQKGIGTAMVLYAKEQAVQYGFTSLFAIILESNEASIALMKKCGFEQWAYLPKVACFDGVLCGQVYYGINL